MNFACLMITGQIQFYHVKLHRRRGLGRFDSLRFARNRGLLLTSTNKNLFPSFHCYLCWAHDGGSVSWWCKQRSIFLDCSSSGKPHLLPPHGARHVDKVRRCFQWIRQSFTVRSMHCWAVYTLDVSLFLLASYLKRINLQLSCDNY